MIFLEPYGDGFRTLPGTSYSALEKFVGSIREAGADVIMNEDDGATILVFGDDPNALVHIKATNKAKGTVHWVGDEIRLNQFAIEEEAEKAVAYKLKHARSIVKTMNDQPRTPFSYEIVSIAEGTKVEAIAEEQSQDTNHPGMATVC